MRVIRAPFFLIGLLFSFIPATFIFATVTVGTWIEMGINRAKLPMPSDDVLMVIGMVAYAVGGILIPVYVGWLVLGWGVAILMPVVMVGVIAVIDRW